MARSSRRGWRRRSSAASNPVPTRPGVAQARIVVVADEQGPEGARAVALAREPTADHQLLAAADLHLAPGRGSLARQVGAVGPLGDQALQAGGLGVLVQRAAVTDVVGRDPPGRGLVPLVDQLGEEAPAVEVGEGDQLVAVEPEQVEGDEGHRVVAGLEAAEVGATVLVQDHHLAVQHRGPAHGVGQAGQLWPARGGVVAPRRLQAQGGRPARIEVGQQAHPVPLDLVGPALVVVRGEHPADRLHGQEIGREGGHGVSRGAREGARRPARPPRQPPPAARRARGRRGG